MKSKAITDELYHIFNRGTDKRVVFVDEEDYERFLLSMKEFNAIKPVYSLYFKSKMDAARRSKIDVQPLPALVEVIAYCLNPNHFHFILKQKEENGIPEFMKRLSGGYTRYFNEKHKRSGSLFQGRYKAVHVESNEQLLHLSAYVNLNYEIHNFGKSGSWSFSSFKAYTGEKEGLLCEPDIILSQFKYNGKEYEKYIYSNLEYFKQRKTTEKFSEVDVQPLPGRG